MISIKYISFLFIVLFISSCCLSDQESVQEQEPTPADHWESQINKQIKLLGHRNWVVIADAAYPLQSNAGIITLLSDESHLETIKKVSDIIDEQTHIKPIIFLDKEIDFVREESAPGIVDFREALVEIIDAESAQKVLHENIIAMLDEAAELFNIIIIKTDFAIPYTTVFYQLDCKYWNAESEKILREQLSVN